MTISRRDALKSLGAVPFLRFDQASDTAILAAIAEVVLPAEADRAAAVAAFLKWIADYKEGADTDHGPLGTSCSGTRVSPFVEKASRSTGPSPARNYPAQIAALDAAAKAKGAVGFTAATLDQRRAIVEAAIAEAKVERLPARPTGAHIAADLMGQLADINYLRKTPALFNEFRETGMADTLKYKTAADLRANYPQFFWQEVKPYIGDALRYLKVTQEGKLWIANLYANVFSMEHRGQI